MIKCSAHPSLTANPLSSAGLRGPLLPANHPPVKAYFGQDNHSQMLFGSSGHHELGLILNHLGIMMIENQLIWFC